MKKLVGLVLISLLFFGCLDGSGTPTATPVPESMPTTASTPTVEPISAEATASNQILLEAEQKIPISTGFLAEVAGVPVHAPKEYSMTSQGSVDFSVSLESLTELQFDNPRVLEALKRVATASRYTKTISVSGDSFELTWTALDADGRPGDVVGAKLYKNRPSRICVNEKTGAVFSEIKDRTLQFAEPGGYAIGSQVQLTNGYTVYVKDLSVFPIGTKLETALSVELFDSQGNIVDAMTMTPGQQYDNNGVSFTFTGESAGLVQITETTAVVPSPSPDDIVLYEGRVFTGESARLANEWNLKLVYLGQTFEKNPVTWASLSLYDQNWNLLDVYGVIKGGSYHNLGVDAKVVDAVFNFPNKHYADLYAAQYPYTFPPAAIVSPTPTPTQTPSATPSPTPSLSPNSTPTPTAPAATTTATPEPSTAPTPTPAPQITVTENCVIPTEEQVNELWGKLQNNQLEEALALFVPDATLKELLKVERKGDAEFAARACTEFALSLTDAAITQLNDLGGAQLADLTGTVCLDQEYGFPLKTEIKTSLASLSENVIVFDDAPTTTPTPTAAEDLTYNYGFKDPENPTMEEIFYEASAGCTGYGNLAELTEKKGTIYNQGCIVFNTENSLLFLWDYPHKPPGSYRGKAGFVKPYATGYLYGKNKKNVQKIEFKTEGETHQLGPFDPEGQSKDASVRSLTSPFYIEVIVHTGQYTPNGQIQVSTRIVPIKTNREVQTRTDRYYNKEKTYSVCAKNTCGNPVQYSTNAETIQTPASDFRGTFRPVSVDQDLDCFSVRINEANDPFYTVAYCNDSSFKKYPAKEPNVKFRDIPVQIEVTDLLKSGANTIQVSGRRIGVCYDKPRSYEMKGCHPLTIYYHEEAPWFGAKAG